MLCSVGMAFGVGLVMIGRSAVCAAVLAWFPAQASADDLDVWGHWYTPDGASIVAIEDCGDGTPCGRVAWVDGEHGGMAHDQNNRDEELRGRAMVGITLLSGFQERRNIWRSGAIYNPRDGRTYRARMRLLSHDTLGVSGCLGPVCKELVWDRAPALQASGQGARRTERVASR